MANTGFKHDSAISEVFTGVALTQGGTITYTHATAIDLDAKSGAILYVDVDYSNHALATAGLTITLLRLCNAAEDLETDNCASVKFQMPFTQNSTERFAIPLSGKNFHKFKAKFDWGNTTAGSAVTIALYKENNDVPAAS